MNRLACAAAVFLAFSFACQAEETYRYAANLTYFEHPGDRQVLLYFQLRKNGDLYTQWTVALEPTSPYFAQFQKAVANFETKDLFFEVVLRTEIPRARGMPALNLGMVTEETSRQVAEAMTAMSERNRARRQPTMADIVSLREISQNEFLGINPKIVKP